VEGLDPQSVFRPGDGALDLPLQEPPRWAGNPMPPNEGDRGHPGALRLPAVHVLLRREGWPVNSKRVYRLYREMGPAIAQQNAQTQGQGQAARRPPPSQKLFG
jgi:hypothetical protein